jgi:hypothetical protein
MRLEYILFVEDSTCSDVHLVEEKMNEVNQKYLIKASNEFFV